MRNSIVMNLTPSPMMKTLAVAMLASLVSACAVGPAYQRPDNPQSERFRHAPNQVQESPSEWWRGFNDPLMTQLVEQALTANQDIAQALGRIEQAQAWTRRARAERLPMGDISAQTGRRHDSLESPQGRVSQDSPAFERNYDYHETGVQASWELDLFDRLRRQSEAALARHDQVSAEWHGVRIAIAAQTADAYVQLIQAGQQKTLLHRQIDNQRLAVQLNQQRFDAQVIGVAELRHTQAELASLEAELPSLEQWIGAQHHRLAVLTGSNPSEFELPDLPDNLPAAPWMAGFEQPDALLRARPDVMAAEHRLIAATAQVGSAMADYYPSLSLTGVLGLQATTGGAFASSNAVNAAGLLGLRWRLFDFARVDAEIQHAQGQRAEALAGYRQALLLAAEDVENALLARQALGDELAKRRDTEVHLQEVHGVADAAWTARQSSRLVAIAAEQQWLSARRGVSAAETQVVQAQIRLYKATGKS